MSRPVSPWPTQSRPASWLAVFIALVATSVGAHAETLTVGSKNFAENRLLGEMFAQLIEEKTDHTVTRRLGLAGTEFCFKALQNGEIDFYPEYTGTGLVTLLDQEPVSSATEALNRVRVEFLERWNLWWLAPLGFENAYEIAVPRQLADAEGLRSISDLARIAPRLRAAFGAEFLERADGLPGLREAYGVEFGNLQSMLEAPKYQAAGAGSVDVLDVYTTDGRLLVFDLQVLEDDRSFFPPYEAAALVRGETLEQHPEVGRALSLLTNALSGEDMRQINLRLQEEHEPLELVARQTLERLGLVGEQEFEQLRSDGSLMSYFWNRRATIGGLVAEHVTLCAISLLLGIAVAVPLGLALERLPSGAAENAIRLIGTSQTIPSLALLGFLIPLVGVGFVPTILALWLYSIFPILRNTFSGLRDADPEAVQAAIALGMSPSQVRNQVRLPLAVPTIMAGVRTAGVITVGTATLAAFIGAGGLGEPIISGVQLVDSRQILSGAIPAALLALVVDVTLGRCERLLRPRGID